MGKLVQRQQNIFLTLGKLFKSAFFTNTLLQTKVSNSVQKQRLCRGNVRIFLLLAENGLLSKKSVFSFCTIKIIFLLLKAKYPTKIVDKPTFKQHPHVAKAFS